MLLSTQQPNKAKQFVACGHLTSGVIDLRATYGGISVSVGVVLLILASTAESLRLALLATAIVLLAMAAG